jgi:hypothetical protein
MTKGSSDFANTDLDLQLKKHGIHQLIVIGLIAHTCVEATVRYGAELTLCHGRPLLRRRSAATARKRVRYRI